MPDQLASQSSESDDSFKQGPQNQLGQTASAATPTATSEGSNPLFKQGPQDRLSRTAGAVAPSGGSAVHAVTSVGAIFHWPVRIYWEDTDAGGIVFYANYLKFFERSRTEWLRSLGIEQHQLRQDTGCMFVVTETRIRYLRPARLDDQLTVTSTLHESGRASLIIGQQALLKKEHPEACQTLLCEGTIRIGWVNASTLQPMRIPSGILESLGSPMLQNAEKARQP